MVMAAVTACQSWQWYLKMRKYVNTLCLVGLEDKQTTSYFLCCSRRTNVKGSCRLQSLHHLFVSIWTIVAITLNIPTPLNGLTNESRSILLFSIPFHQKRGRSICIPPRPALWIRNPLFALLTSPELRATSNLFSSDFLSIGCELSWIYPQPVEILVKREPLETANYKLCKFSLFII